MLKGGSVCVDSETLGGALEVLLACKVEQADITEALTSALQSFVLGRPSSLRLIFISGDGVDLSVFFLVG